MCCRCQWLTAERKTDVYSLPDARTREGIPHKSLPDKETKDRDGTQSVSHRKTNQDLVSKPKDETEKRDSGHQRAKRAGEASSTPEGVCSRGGSCPELRAQLGTVAPEVGRPPQVGRTPERLPTPTAGTRTRAALQFGSSW